MPGCKIPKSCRAVSENKPSTSLTRVACKSKLCLCVSLSMQPFQGTWVAIGCAVVHYARVAHAFSAGIKLQHCQCSLLGKLHMVW